MRKIVTFLQESYAELKKVSWPGWDEVVQSTKVVIVSTVLIALFLGFVDLILFRAIDLIF